MKQCEKKRYGGKLNWIWNFPILFPKKVVGRAARFIVYFSDYVSCLNFRKLTVVPVRSSFLKRSGAFKSVRK